MPAEAGMALDKSKFCPLSQEQVLVSRWDRNYYGQWVKTQYWVGLPIMNDQITKL
jgi:hypothetical protein